MEIDHRKVGRNKLSRKWRWMPRKPLGKSGCRARNVRVKLKILDDVVTSSRLNEML